MTARERYAREGYLCPVTALSPAEAAEFRSKLEAFEEEEPERAPTILRHKGHVALAWLSELVRHPGVLDPVAEIRGPDLLCWTSNAFIKNPGDGAFVSWHQDATYWGLSSDEVVTAWIALSPSDPGNGCMRVVPGSHAAQQMPHQDTVDDRNLLTRGQEVAVEVDESEAVDLILEPGQMSLHHVLIVHGSAPAARGDRRIGIAARYVPTSIRQTSGMRDTATLVRGEDRYGHFDLEPIPGGRPGPRRAGRLRQGPGRQHGSPVPGDRRGVLSGGRPRSHTRRIIDALPVILRRRTMGRNSPWRAQSA